MAYRPDMCTFTNITSATTTQVKNGRGILKRVVVNVPVSTGTISIYDAQSATTAPIAIITSTTDLKPFYLDYDTRFSNGLNVVTTQAQNITIIWE